MVHLAPSLGTCKMRRIYIYIYKGGEKEGGKHRREVMIYVYIVHTGRKDGKKNLQRRILSVVAWAFILCIKVKMREKVEEGVVLRLEMLTQEKTRV